MFPVYKTWRYTKQFLNFTLDDIANIKATNKLVFLSV